MGITKIDFTDKMIEEDFEMPDPREYPECPECRDLLHTRKELRADGQYEFVDYCEGCGFTATG